MDLTKAIETGVFEQQSHAKGLEMLHSSRHMNGINQCEKNYTMTDMIQAFPWPSILLHRVCERGQKSKRQYTTITHSLGRQKLPCCTIRLQQLFPIGSYLKYSKRCEFAESDWLRRKPSLSVDFSRAVAERVLIEG